MLMRPYHYQLTTPVPEINGDPYDILVWQYPRVYLTRRAFDQFGADSIVVIKLGTDDSDWRLLFSKYERRLAPLEIDAPPVRVLAGSLPRSMQRGAQPEVVTTLIQASSDEGALFELLSSVGCGLPRRPPAEGAS